MSVLAPPPSPTPSHLDVVLSDSDINLDHRPYHQHLQKQRFDMPSNGNPPASLKRKPSLQTPLSDAENQQPETTPSNDSKPTPTKRAKTESPLVDIKNGKLHFKQKPFNWSLTMPVMRAIIDFQTFLSGAGKLDEVPQDQLHVIAKLVQESDKTINELAKLVRNSLMPEADLFSDESQNSASSTTTSPRSKLTLPLIVNAIEKVAERRNYGLDISHISSASSGLASDDITIPAGLQLWRWEVRDTSLLPKENLEKIVARRKEREAVRDQAAALFASLPETERQALLKRRAKAAGAAVKESAAATATATSSSRAIEPIVIDDDGSEGDVEAGTSKQQTPSRPRKRQTSKESSGPTTPASSNSSSPRKKEKATPKAELSPEKLREKEEKEAAKAEKLKLQQARKAEKDARDAEAKRKREARAAEIEKEHKLQQKQASFLTSFMQKAQAKTAKRPVLTTVASPGKSDFDRTFLPCQYKDLAPINRFHKPQQELELDRSELTKDQMLADLKQMGRRGAHRAPRPKGVHPPVSVREIKRIVTESDVLGGNAEELARKALEDLKDRKKVPIKLLSFISDRRPGWYGTWTKSTNLIGPRCPLSQDPVALDYNHDSDAEWEEPGLVDGDDVADGDDREESAVDSDEDSEMDDWLVDDLEVEEEDDAMALDDDGDIVEVDAQGRPLPASSRQPLLGPRDSPFASSTPASTAASSANILKPKKKKVKLLGRRFDSKLVPFATGPHWEAVLGQPEYEHFQGYQIEFLNDACFGLDPFTFHTTSEEDKIPEATLPSTSSGLLSSPSKPSSSGSSSKPPLAGGVLASLWGVAKPDGAGAEAAAAATSSPTAPTLKQSFPESEVPKLLRAIEGSTKTRPGLVDDLKELFEPLGRLVSKNALNERLPFYAAKEGKKQGAAWRVKEEYRSLAGL
ncbi:uncharacterized protein PFL1_06835 [Pseudozyma flocculosa PF-1]|uniref:Chromatin assembly factor 1 subunit A dimerization domain-containing protein n=1 Tax=Pseudozyma flocculosa TaxID=84751 RepID=A0A5C3EQH8_9BASI|nr:uncharacterized protein PFL1_06835 [Pseudozyma flocculosa PF-1]EPQ32459.1 hypothetical protein PFL1_06835 [Pseudozyma flocculosa PF-1]SPO34553.1 uncharacterized protein PSFLO_00024 [Pseudozyma flocculosa]